MRTLITCLIILAPALAQASPNVDFNCEGAKDVSAIGGTIRLGKGARIDMEDRNGFPAFYLVGAALNEGEDRGSSVRFVSEPDSSANDTIATLDMPSDYVSQRQVLAKLQLRYKSPQDNKMKVLNYDLRCDRQN